MPADRRQAWPPGSALGILLLLAALPCAAAAAGDSPKAWLERMANAVEYLNYEGTLVHLNGGDTSVMHVTHRVEKGRVTERIISDDGGRQIIRTDDEVTCIFPDQRTVLVEPRDDGDQSQSPLRGHLPRAASIDASLYLLSFAAPERIAGRDTKGIAIRPKDAFRYGYRIWVDRATGMPLKTQLVDEQNRVLEQVLFTQIMLPGQIPVSAVKPSVPIDSFAVRRTERPAVAAADPSVVDWGASELPPGFKVAVRKAKVAPDAGSGLRHVVYSDGLATVSLFVEPAVAASEQAEGLSQIGAANAYTTTIDGHMVTAIGEVPARTVEIFAQSARPVAPVARRR
jgi:sigma-E factor negative regulatory protein RseB